MNIGFDGKKSLVTGAGKGIGKGVALKLAEWGAKVLAISRTQSDLEELSELNSNIKTLCLDIENFETTKDALQDIGPIDLLVNNAGVSAVKEFGNYEEEDFDKIFNINVKAMFNISQMVANGMKARGQGGSIVNVSSITGMKGAVKFAVYGSSKAAVIHLSKCMATELGPYNIRVNCVCPTVIRTRMSAELFKPDSTVFQYMMNRSPLKRFGEIEEVVDPILFLLSDSASLITGAILTIDSGCTSTL